VSDAGLAWRTVAAGPFSMGSDPAAAYPPEPDEGPRHRVQLEPFRLARTAVTRAQYRIFAAANGRSLPVGGRGDDELPATYVSHADALAFCAWAGVRLPSEAEWERAARGGDERLWPWGDELPTPARACFGQEIGNPCAAGSLPGGASAEGVLDLAGNAWEWVSSSYRPYPYDAGDGRERREGGELRVVRGGSFLSGPGELRCSFRQPLQPGARDHYVGFRVAADRAEPRIAFDWVELPGGPAMLGRDPIAAGGPVRADELPLRLVELPAFELSLSPVTNAQYALFLSATGAEAPPHWEGARVPAGRETHPVSFVDWFEAGAFCAWAGGRLPTEAEWEKGARGGDCRTYPWGREPDVARAALGAGLKHGSTSPVGARPAGASPFGLLDMAGNVWEWVSSAYRPYPYDPADGREQLGGSCERVLRGGSFASPGLGHARCAMRSHSSPVRRQAHIGFRVARGARASGATPTRPRSLP
jgi:formylglycine-generating enzyme required for sulfatase activity